MSDWVISLHKSLKETASCISDRIFLNSDYRLTPLIAKKSAPSPRLIFYSSIYFEL